MNLFNKISLISMLAIPFFASANQIELREYEKLWEYKGREKKHLDEFASWWGNENAISRILARLHIIQKEYKSVLDVGCGFCTDHDALKKSCKDLQYFAIDLAPLFVQKAIDRGISAQIARAQQMPFEDSSFDVIYARHLLEHMDGYQSALQEMIRVAKNEVMVVFFIKPQSAAVDKMGFIDVNGYPIYQNRYSKSKIEAFLKGIEKVKSFAWQEVKNKDECILHIYV